LSAFSALIESIHKRYQSFVKDITYLAINSYVDSKNVQS